MSTLADDSVALRAVCERAADDTGVPYEIVEKDYWATRCLAAVTRAATPQGVVFKGGTSLSKALHLIERYSEDVDLIVTLPEGLGTNASKRAFARVADEVAAEIGCAWTKDGYHGSHGLNARYSYPTELQSMTAFTEGVLLEMGDRGGPHPTEQHMVEPILGATARDAFGLAFDDLQPFEVTVLAPERTLAEKLDALHRMATEHATDELAKGARHLYDIARLLDNAIVRQRCERGAVRELIGDINERSTAAGWKWAPRPEGGFAASPAFTDPVAINAIAAGWDRVDRLVYGVRLSPTQAVDVVLAAAPHL